MADHKFDPYPPEQPVDRLFSAKPDVILQGGSKLTLMNASDVESSKVLSAEQKQQITEAVGSMYAGQDFIGTQLPRPKAMLRYQENSAGGYDLQQVYVGETFQRGNQSSHVEFSAKRILDVQSGKHSGHMNPIHMEFGTDDHGGVKLDTSKAQEFLREVDAQKAVDHKSASIDAPQEVLLAAREAVKPGRSAPSGDIASLPHARTRGGVSLS